jgi:hypothetical protein
MLGVLMILKSLPTHVQNPKFPCNLCKGNHLLKGFPGIPKVLEVLSHGYQQPTFPSVAGHASENPSIDNHEVGGKRVKSRFLAGYVGK